MNKYDFGYSLLPGSTNDWAFQQVEAGARVLEIGSSNGNLISHLTREKGCVADIVEIDGEAGQQAARFARTACIGELEGDLQKEYWRAKLSGNRYDYIIILDVLEHICNPEQVLGMLVKLLDDNGTILLSVPNIAHNSVLLGLLQNEFNYTPVGLLDNTHIHFYTYESLKQMLQNVGLTAETEEVIQKEVEDTEISERYGRLPSAVESYLKTRPLGTAYQYLFKVKRGLAQAGVRLQYQEDQHYTVVAFQGDTVIYERRINPRNRVEGKFAWKEPLCSLRLDPLDKNCVIKDWGIQGFDKDNTQVEITSLQFTGNALNDRIIFYDDDPQIYVDWEKSVTSVSFWYTIEVFDTDALRVLVDERDYVRALQAGCQESVQLRTELETKHQEVRQLHTDLEAERQHSNQLRLELENECRTTAQQHVDLETLHQALLQQKRQSEQLQADLEAEHQVLLQWKQQSEQLQTDLEAEHQVLLQWKQQYEQLCEQLRTHRLASIWKIVSGNEF